MPRHSSTSIERYDFSTTRPIVRLDDDRQRRITWPENQLLAARVPAAARDVVILVGLEPQLQWRRFCRQVLGVAEAIEASTIVTLGALLADVPHTRPVQVFGAAEDPALQTQLDLAPSSYEGPTGIVGALTTQAAEAGFPTATFWASVPSYVPGALPKAALALVHHVCEVVGTTVFVTDLEIAAASYERQADELVAEDDETADYVHDLEAAWDADDEIDELDDDPELLVAEVEEFLRDVDDAIGRGMLSRSSVVRASDRASVRSRRSSDRRSPPDRLIQDLVTEPIEDRSLR